MKRGTFFPLLLVVRAWPEHSKYLLNIKTMNKSVHLHMKTQIPKDLLQYVNKI